MRSSCTQFREKKQKSLSQIKDKKYLLNSDKIFSLFLAFLGEKAECLQVALTFRARNWAFEILFFCFKVK